jgi:hypothetical protein
MTLCVSVVPYWAKTLGVGSCDKHVVRLSSAVKRVCNNITTSYSAMPCMAVASADSRRQSAASRCVTSRHQPPHPLPLPAVTSRCCCCLLPLPAVTGTCQKQLHPVNTSQHISCADAIPTMISLSVWAVTQGRPTRVSYSESQHALVIIC